MEYRSKIVLFNVTVQTLLPCLLLPFFSHALSFVQGGGMYIYDSTVTMSSMTVSVNSAVSR